MCKALAIHDTPCLMELLIDLEMDVCSFLLGRYLGVELLDCLVIVCSTFVNIGVPFCTPTSSDETVNCSTPSPTLGVVRLF